MGFFKRENNLISYTIDKSFTNNLAISVQNGQVAVTAPWYISKKQIEQVISEKKNWIMKKLKEYEKLNRMKKINLEKETLKVLGEDYNLKISYKLINIPELNLENKLIKIDLPVKYRNIDNTRIIKLILDKFYERLAEKEIEKIMEKIRIQTGLVPEDYKIEKMSCILGKYIEENKNVVINPEVVKFDKEIIEYVILHQVCHLKYKTHAKSFNRLLKEYIPNYKMIEEKIKGMF